LKHLRSSIVLASLLASLSTVSVSAQTIGYAEAYDRIAKACGSDIAKLCSNVPLANGGVKNCLAKNQAKVSSVCKSTTAQTFALLEKRAVAQTSALKVCDADSRRLCQGVVAHDGYRLQCLLKAERFTRAACNQVITDAGWR
jgi:hypothetical protein